MVFGSNVVAFIVFYDAYFNPDVVGHDNRMPTAELHCANTANVIVEFFFR